jgi:lipopolysaccharide export system permease protein
MELEGAFRYVRRIRMMDANQYAQQASRLYERLLGNLTPLILMIISCSTVFTWRKNVLILSILASLAIAVVYFVMQMLSMILARQGIYAPLWGPLAPMLALLGLSGVIATLRRI